MGKKTPSSWFAAVKRVFRSPSSKDDDDKKREKRRWLFRKPSAMHEQTPLQQQEKLRAKTPAAVAVTPPVTPEQRHAIAMAIATAATAEAAVATAQAAAEVVRLTRPAPPHSTRSSFAQEHYAAVAIQTAFRGYLARRALRALRGLVKLQALIRGQNVRRQANMTLRCMQALVRVQARFRNQRLHLSAGEPAVCSATSSKYFSDASFWDSRRIYDIATVDRTSMSREGSSLADDWDDRPRNIVEIQAMIKSRKEAVLKRERVLSYAFSQQLRRSDRNPSPSIEEQEAEEGYSAGGDGEQQPPRWIERWMASRTSCTWDYSSRGRSSTDRRDPIKTLEIDTGWPHSSTAATNRRQQPQLQRPQSPLQRSPAKARLIQVGSSSPCCGRHDEDHRKYSFCSYYGNPPGSARHHHHYNYQGQQTGIPNYMAATESAKAKLRSQSAPRQRPGTPECERTSLSGASGMAVKKRLSFPAPQVDPYGYSQNLRSPSFKSAHGRFLSEQRSNVSSTYTESEVSPSSTTDLRRWLR